MKYSGKKILRCLVVVGVFICAAFVLQLHQARAQQQGCNSGIPNDCQINLSFPDCYVCNGPAGTPTGTCVPDDTLCDSLNTNQCRADSCLPNAVPGVTTGTNHSGCDYTEISSMVNPVCINCLPPDTNCGNGICEADQGENCSNCPIDCMVPGWDQPTCPVDPNSINPNGPGVCAALITFSGPPFNQPGSGNCEDGDVCTSNQCDPNSSQCLPSVPLTCNPVSSDLCCSTGCNPPVNGSCNGVNNCDVDCLPPVNCQPTPSPTPLPPIRVGCLQGSGNITGGTGGPGCDGFACSLNKNASVPPAANLLLLGVVLGGLGVGIYLRRRAD
jgi:hypothetical protein